MKIYYDLHMHSCLSPCGDDEMTPFNLVNMAALKGLNVIALTDHNTCKNCPAALEAGKEAGILVVPGMELCTQEEIHVVCLFPALESAMAFDGAVERLIPPIPNKPEIFGHQRIMDAADGVLGEWEPLLITGADISLYGVRALVEAHGGACFPAHIDRDSFSVLSVLGEYPPEIGFPAAEITGSADAKALRLQYPALMGLPLLTDSDAHYLEDISEPMRFMELESLSAKGLIRQLRKGDLVLGETVQ